MAKAATRWIVCTAAFMVFSILQLRMKKSIGIDKGTSYINGTEAFMFFVTASYTPLVDTFLESLHEFSNRSILVFGIDIDVSLDRKRFPRAIPLKITGAAHSVYFNKIKTALHALSMFDRVIYIEPDSVVNYRVDDLWDIIAARPNLPYPILPRHPLDPKNQAALMKDLGVDRKSMPYGHGHLMFTRRTMSFFIDAFMYSQQGVSNTANFDETLINVLMWKMNAATQACLFDPYGADETENEWYFHHRLLDSTPKDKPLIDIRAYHVFHGIKDPNYQRELFEKLKDLAKSNPPPPVYFSVNENRWLTLLNDVSNRCLYQL